MTTPKDSGGILNRELKRLYNERVRVYGDSYRSVYYSGETLQLINFESILQVVKDPENRHTLLDVGCGLSHLYDFILEKGLKLKYTGIDFSENMIEAAKTKKPPRNVHCGTIDDLPPEMVYDFVVAIGVFTRKVHNAKDDEIEKNIIEMIRSMFSRAESGIAFNMITSHVDYRKSGLYYSNPGKIFDFCRNTLTRHIVIRHEYPLWDFTVYAYKPNYIKRVYRYYR